LPDRADSSMLGPMRDLFHVLLLRHGQTDSNANGAIQGWLPVPLNATGRAQSEQLSARLKTFVPRVRRVISSDLVRARQTAEPIAAALGVEPVFDPRWRERGLGEMEGQTIGERETWRAATGETDAAGAEPVQVFRDRAEAALRSLHAEYAGDGVVAVAVVTHGGTIRSVLQHFASGRLRLDEAHRSTLDSPDLQTIANCSIIHLVGWGGGSSGELRWGIACVNDVAHLADVAVTSRDRG
jgi:probable phosphoglycerate mutase